MSSVPCYCEQCAGWHCHSPGETPETGWHLTHLLKKPDFPRIKLDSFWVLHISEGKNQREQKCVSIPWQPLQGCFELGWNTSVELWGFITSCHPHLLSHHSSCQEKFWAIISGSLWFIEKQQREHSLQGYGTDRGKKKSILDQLRSIWKSSNSRTLIKISVGYKS